MRETNYSPWKVTSQVLGDKRKYAVCRIINIKETEHAGNREYTDHGYMESKEEALAIVEALNAEGTREIK